MPWPLRHLSVRVPWHDSGWDGRVCADPTANTSCLVLKAIGPNRDDAAEHAVRGQSLKLLDADQYPCCKNERVAFMAPFEMTWDKAHPYAETSPDTHGHFRPTPLRRPAYSADAVPFRWMQRPSHWAAKNKDPDFRDVLSLDLDPSREPELSFSTNWMQQRDNHLAVLNCFFDHVRPQQSLVFFYAKRTPLAEDPRRVIVGVGRVNSTGENTEYQYAMAAAKAPLRSMLWERLVQHTIRPGKDGIFRDGFLLPYTAALDHAAVNANFDPASVTAFAPADRQAEFSYVTEHVTHDGAIGGLLACAAALRETAKHLSGPWDVYQKWIDTELAGVWKHRGPCPGLGVALAAFGLELGVLTAHDLSRHVGENEDPWPIVDRMFKEPKKLLTPDLARRIDRDAQAEWKALADERRQLLKLLSRFDLDVEQAKTLYEPGERKAAGIALTDGDVLKNPYALYEASRLTAAAVSLETVDRGVFPEQVVAAAHPLPEPTRLETGTDVRRVRAWTVKVLEGAAEAGDTLLPREDVTKALRDLEIRPACEVTTDRMSLAEKSFKDGVDVTPLDDGTPAFQLPRLTTCGALIRKAVEARVQGKRHAVTADWQALLAKALGPVKPGDELEERSRAEKTAALGELAAARFAVLIGSAGTGKTTLLALLCGQPAIRAGGVLLLAPTGKARVRMAEAARTYDLDFTGQTIAGYLRESGRYDPATQRYRMLGPKAEKGKVADTVIIDEASMLTEEMLAATLEAVSNAKRIILVGDHRQLPPIGAGRPFVDVIAKLRPERFKPAFPLVVAGYAELTINWRQKPNAPDARLAAWFAGDDPGPGEEVIFAEIATPSDRLKVLPWRTAEECQTLLLRVLQEELKLNGPTDLVSFDKSLGGTESGGLCYFNRTWEKGGVGAAAENWQILSPVRQMPFGVAGLNRLIHGEFRAQNVTFARKKFHKTPSPIGPEEIVYGDKVICVRNQRRWWDHYPADNCQQFVANGEIGIVVGQFQGKQTGGKLPWMTQVEFTSQPGYTYGYKDRDFSDEGDAPLELAYALTVHKAQGSEFGTVVFVLPNPCRLLTRELLYTAFTRQKQRIVILFQGQPSDLRNYSRPEHSETARRLTNIFTKPAPVVVHQVRFDAKHIHRTERGELVMSKSEVLIADKLFARDIDYAYEKELSFGPDRTCKPDFTIENAATGRTYFWEHCGMLHDPEYRKRWERKKAWYRKNGVLPLGEGGGPNGILIETSDDLETGFDSAAVAALIDQTLT